MNRGPHYTAIAMAAICAGCLNWGAYDFAAYFALVSFLAMADGIAEKLK